MRRFDKRQTFITFAQRVAQEHGHNIDRETANFVLWEYTGFPSFWDGDPMECVDRQLSEFFAKAETTE